MVVNINIIVSLFILVIIFLRLNTNRNTIPEIFDHFRNRFLRIVFDNVIDPILNRKTFLFISEEASYEGLKVILDTITEEMDIFFDETEIKLITGGDFVFKYIDLIGYQRYPSYRGWIEANLRKWVCVLMLRCSDYKNNLQPLKNNLETILENFQRYCSFGTLTEEYDAMDREVTKREMGVFNNEIFTMGNALLTGFLTQMKQLNNILKDSYEDQDGISAREPVINRLNSEIFPSHIIENLKHCKEILYLLVQDSIILRLLVSVMVSKGIFNHDQSHITITTIAELVKTVKTEVENSLQKITHYYTSRGNLISKVVQSVHDRQNENHEIAIAIRDLDKRMCSSVWSILQNARKYYFLMYNFSNKHLSIYLTLEME